MSNSRKREEVGLTEALELLQEANRPFDERADEGGWLAS